MGKRGIRASDLKVYVIKFLKLLLQVLVKHWIGLLIGSLGVVITVVSASLSNVFCIFKKLFYLKITINMPLWIMVVILPPILYIIIKAIFNMINSLTYRKKYTSLDYGIWRLKWDYEYSKKDKKYNIVNLRPICKCGCGLSELKDKYGQFVCKYCANCKIEVKEFIYYDAVYQLIIYNIENKEYKTDYSYEINDE